MINAATLGSLLWLAVVPSLQLTAGDAALRPLACVDAGVVPLEAVRVPVLRA
jgi:hypothetical protein